MTNRVKGLAILAAGISLSALAGYAGYWLSYKQLPARRIRSAQWVRNASMEAFTAQVMMSIRRGVWPHDAYSIFSYGDEDTVAFILEHLPPDVQIDDCDYGHIQDALRTITNQDPGRYGRDWLAWWKTNEHKAVTEWVRDGFAVRGIGVTTSGAPVEVATLLSILGQNFGGTNRPAYPPYMVHNARRWLRDLGVRPVDYALTNSSLSPEALTGLRRYDMLYQDGWQVADTRLWKRGRHHPEPPRLNWYTDTWAFDSIPPLLLLSGVLLAKLGISIWRTRPSTVTSTRGTPPADAPGAPGFRPSHG